MFLNLCECALSVGFVYLLSGDPGAVALQWLWRGRIVKFAAVPAIQAPEFRQVLSMEFRAWECSLVTVSRTVHNPTKYQEEKLNNLIYIKLFLWHGDC
jgi:hypothetical protein